MDNKDFAYLIVYQTIGSNNVITYNNSLILANNKSEAYKKFLDSHVSPIIINIIEL